jgi:hypothetical protein
MYMYKRTFWFVQFCKRLGVLIIFEQRVSKEFLIAFCSQSKNFHSHSYSLNEQKDSTEAEKLKEIEDGIDALERDMAIKQKEKVCVSVLVSQAIKQKDKVCVSVLVSQAIKQKRKYVY